MRFSPSQAFLRRCRSSRLWLFAGTLFASLPDQSLAAEAATFTAYAPGKATLAICRGEEGYLRFGMALWGPNWSWTALQGSSQSEGGAAISKMTATLGGARPQPNKEKKESSLPPATEGTPAVLRLDFRAERLASNRLQLTYELQSEKDADLTAVVVTVEPGTSFSGRDVIVESAGKQTSVPCPFGRRRIGKAISALNFTDAAGRKTVMHFEPPCEIEADGDARVVLAKDNIKANTVRRQNVIVDLPEPMTWYASAARIPDLPGLERWYPWRAKGMGTNSLLNMTDWLEKPAGKYGRITRDGERLLYHGQPIKLWGINLCYAACAPEKAEAEKRGRFYAQYGINAVRLHKFAAGSGWSGIQAKESSAEYDPKSLDRMDYQVAKFKEAGVYVELSAHFGTITIGPADRQHVPYVDELGTWDQKNKRVTAPASAFYYSRELQNLHIRQIVNLLKHRNPYTGRTYAEEPAICILECINEQSVLFYTSMSPLKQSATLRQQMGQRFSDWLRKKYGGPVGLLKAWGAKALDPFQHEGFAPGEDLEKRNILPLGHPWYWDPKQLSQSPLQARLLDTLQFLYELQCEAYDRYVTAVREAGYEGEIVASNWQAGRAFSHYANLHSDARVGLIDRHNYFGGSKRGGLGSFNADSMLAHAGSGSLSTGLQQVENLPFILSEWIHVFPNEWGAEGSALIGAYGLGLQGWDASFMFENKDNAAFNHELGATWDVTTPQILGLFPAVARQVLRGDVQEAGMTAVRSVHVPSLFEGRLGFEDQLKQGYDDKELDSAQVPARALAAVRCVVRFTNQFEKTPALDLKPYEQDGAIVSATKQLWWKQGEARKSGFFTINTDGTKAVVGFAQGQVCHLDPVTISPQSLFAAIYVSALEKNGTIATSRHLLITTLARARNTGMKFNPAGNELLEKGKGPILIEPVKATIGITGRRLATIRLLDHDGQPTATTLPMTNGQFILDGVRDKTPYYEVTLE